MEKTDLKADRKKEVQAHKRQSILDAAAGLFRQKGLDGTTMRAIATAAGYSTGAPYAYFQSKEEIYADLLHSSLLHLNRTIKSVASATYPPERQIQNVFSAYYDYYHIRPEELQLGLYLFSTGEVKKRGFSDETNKLLNNKLLGLLGFMANCLHQQTELDASLAQQETLDAVTYFTGCLMLETTGRLDTIGANPEEMIDRYIDQMLKRCGY